MFLWWGFLDNNGGKLWKKIFKYWIIKKDGKRNKYVMLLKFCICNLVELELEWV